MTQLEKFQTVYDDFSAHFASGLSNLLWQIIVNKTRFVDLTSCFVSTYPGKHDVGIADRDKSGYTPTTAYFNEGISLDERYRIIEELNYEVFGLRPDQADVIVASSMRTTVTFTDDGTKEEA